MQKCVDLLAPFEETTRELSKSNVLISSVIPLIQVLTKKLHKQLNKIDNSETVTHLITALKTSIDSKFSDLYDNFLFTLSTFLDPRYKAKFFSEFLKENVETEILRLLCNAQETYSPSPKRSRVAAPSEAGGEEQPSTSSAHKITLQNELELMLNSSDEDESPGFDDSSDVNFKLKIILKQYSKERKISVSENPLDWWRSRGKTTYKELTVLAQRFLSSPPASVPSEQLFSGAGIIYKPSRNRLEAEKASQLLFLKYNLPLIRFQY